MTIPQYEVDVTRIIIKELGRLKPEHNPETLLLNNVRALIEDCISEIEAELIFQIIFERSRR